jgi:hypothetical protein
MIDGDKPTMSVAGTPGEAEKVRADWERRRTSRVERRRKLTRTIGRRLERLEVRTQQIEAATREPHTLCFIYVSWSRDRFTALSASDVSALLNTCK